jgi:hypothetical protein
VSVTLFCFLQPATSLIARHFFIPIATADAHVMSSAMEKQRLRLRQAYKAREQMLLQQQQQEEDGIRLEAENEKRSGVGAAIALRRRGKGRQAQWTGGGRQRIGTSPCRPQ